MLIKTKTLKKKNSLQTFLEKLFVIAPYFFYIIYLISQLELDCDEINFLYIYFKLYMYCMNFISIIVLKKFNIFWPKDPQRKLQNYYTLGKSEIPIYNYFPYKTFIEIKSFSSFHLSRFKKCVYFCRLLSCRHIIYIELLSGSLIGNQIITIHNISYNRIFLDIYIYVNFSSFLGSYISQIQTELIIQSKSKHTIKHAINLFQTNVVFKSFSNKKIEIVQQIKKSIFP